jgi:DNA modification methylase
MQNISNCFNCFGSMRFCNVHFIRRLAACSVLDSSGSFNGYGDLLMIKPYYQDDYCTIYHGDCREILPQLPKVDLVLTDPPYGLNYQSNRAAKTGNLKAKIKNDSLEEYKVLLVNIVEMFDFIMNENSEGYMFCGGGGGSPILAYAWLELKKARRFKVKNLLVWDKEFVGMGWDWRFQYETIFQLQVGDGINNKMSSSRANVLKCKNVIPQAGDHPTPKPDGLLKQILIPKPSETILDPFMGSGTTLRAAKDLQRKAIGIDIEEKYCEIAAKRLSQEVLKL